MRGGGPRPVRCPGSALPRRAAAPRAAGAPGVRTASVSLRAERLRLLPGCGGRPGAAAGPLRPGAAPAAVPGRPDGATGLRDAGAVPGRVAGAGAPARHGAQPPAPPRAVVARLPPVGADRDGDRSSPPHGRAGVPGQDHRAPGDRGDRGDHRGHPRRPGPGDRPRVGGAAPGPLRPGPVRRARAGDRPCRGGDDRFRRGGRPPGPRGARRRRTARSPAQRFHPADGFRRRPGGQRRRAPRRGHRRGRRLPRLHHRLRPAAACGRSGAPRCADRLPSGSTGGSPRRASTCQVSHGS